MASPRPEAGVPVPAGISFVPQEVGEHLVHISRGGQPLARSPISVTISQAELGDASRVRVAGPGLREGRTFEAAHFTIDTRDAGTSPSPGNWARGCVRGGCPRRRGPC